MRPVFLFIQQEAIIESSSSVDVKHILTCICEKYEAVFHLSTGISFYLQGKFIIFLDFLTLPQKQIVLPLLQVWVTNFWIMKIATTALFFYSCNFLQVLFIEWAVKAYLKSDKYMRERLPFARCCISAF